MTTKEIFELLTMQFPDKGLELFEQEEVGGDPYIKVPKEMLLEVAGFVKNDPRLDFKMCHCVTGVDYKDSLASVIHLYSIEKKHKLALRTDCTREDPKIPSVSNVWQAANWHERESYDLLGIEYEGHPNLRRILLSDDWQGHPLRKDYQLPDDSLFPWEGDEDEEKPAEKVAPRSTTPGAEAGPLKRPDSNAGGGETEEKRDEG